MEFNEAWGIIRQALISYVNFNKVDSASTRESLQTLFTILQRYGISGPIPTYLIIASDRISVYAFSLMQRTKYELAEENFKIKTLKYLSHYGDNISNEAVQLYIDKLKRTRLITPQKYLTELFAEVGIELPGNEINKLAIEWIPATYEVKLTKDLETIRRIYRNGPSSCMS